MHWFLEIHIRGVVWESSDQHKDLWNGKGCRENFSRMCTMGHLRKKKKKKKKKHKLKFIQFLKNVSSYKIFYMT